MRPRLAFRPASVAALAAVLGAVALAGACRTRDPYTDWWWYDQPVPESNITPRVQSGPYMLAMFEGTTGRPLTWTDLWNGMHWADIVVVGEQHDDANAHLVQRTLVEEALAAWPGSAVSMEMLERHEQHMVDAYLAGDMALDAFVDGTRSRDWAGKDSWMRFYQPMVDAARQTHGSVVAANAPREYLRRARLEGYEVLAALPPEERALFDLPAGPPPVSYRERFRGFMAGDGDPPTDEALDTMLRSQRLWDATMAASIVAAWKRVPSGAKVIHVVGQFHSEYDGGLISEIQARAGSARILTVTVQKGEARMLRAADKGKADVVVYGVAPPPTWTAAAARRARAEKATEAAEAARDALPATLPEWGVAH
jgi:uncharacterized iron-regulated protein